MSHSQQQPFFPLVNFENFYLDKFQTLFYIKNFKKKKILRPKDVILIYLILKVKTTILYEWILLKMINGRHDSSNQGSLGSMSRHGMIH